MVCGSGEELLPGEGGVSREEDIPADLVEDWAGYDFQVRYLSYNKTWEAGWFGNIADIIGTGNTAREAIYNAVDRLRDADARSMRTD